ncbi:MAG: DUF1919 domain-containing protein [Mogibacterium sp.]|nr:DUF1919 domain-containing protein [Mogibacterium sp.]
MDYIKRAEWRIYKELKRRRLKNTAPTIISSNCNGEFIYLDMGLRYMTPTINLSFDMNDYVRFLGNLEWYLSLPVKEYKDSRFDYPCGIIDDVKIRFNHYSSFDEAVCSWERRKTRVQYDNLYILGIDGDGCTEESLRKFDELPYEHKVVFTHIPRPDIKSSFYLRGFEGNDGVGVAIDFKNQFRIRRYLDDFDYISFLNE